MALFECPVCFDYVLPPIMQCSSGHLVCAQCRPKLPTCPTCRGQAPSIRNLAMEKVAASVFFPCKYHQNGCQKYSLHTEKIEHEGFYDFMRVKFAILVFRAMRIPTIFLSLSRSLMQVDRKSRRGDGSFTHTTQGTICNQ